MLVSRISLSRLPGERVLVVEADAQHELTLAELPAYVADA